MLNSSVHVLLKKKLLFMEKLSMHTLEILKVSPSVNQWKEDTLATEEPLEIKLEYGPVENRIQKSISITMRTPGQDKDLALGFLWTEGIIQHPNQVQSISAVKSWNPDAAGNIILIRLSPNVKLDLKKLERHFYTSSSCGVCGKSSIDAVHQSGGKSLSAIKSQVSQQYIYKLPGIVKANQAIFQQTGGLHGAGLFDLNGNLLLLKEDVGRHNAVDKLIGAAFQKDWLPIHDKIILLSGRISFELIQKSLMAGIPIVVAVGAPSTLAIHLAKASSMTVVGFVKENSFNIYCGAERVLLEE